MTRRRLAVWGDPIAHSKSPQLHAAAYDVLGVDWEYGRRRVSASAFGETFESLDDSWLGLSLTMPLKEEAHRRADAHDRHADLTGAVNTLLLGEKVVGFNTDVGGIVDALGAHDVSSVARVRILGAGATAASALVAAVEMGARDIDVRARRPERADDLIRLGERLGVDVTIAVPDASTDGVDLTIATLPGGTVLPEPTAARLSERGGTLFDVAYASWPSALASAWGEAAISGEGMLLWQAVRQIRIFVSGDPMTELPDETRVVAAMRAAL